jgi:hypothetical protein
MMKKLLFLILLFIPYKINCQVLVFQTDYTWLAKPNETTKKVDDWGTAIPLDITIVLNSDKESITFNFPTKRVYKILSKQEKKSGIDLGVKWHSFSFNCIDNEGLESIVTFKMYDSGPHLLFVVYDNVVYKFQMKKIEF